MAAGAPTITTIFQAGRRRMERGREHFSVEAALYKELFWKSQPVIYISLANPLQGEMRNIFGAGLMAAPPLLELC